MAITLIHDPTVAASAAFDAAYGAQCDAVLTREPNGPPPIPYLQGYPSVMYDVPAFNQPAQTITNTNPDGTTYQVVVPAYNVPASKAIVFDPPDFATVEDAVTAANWRAVENKPTT